MGQENTFSANKQFGTRYAKQRKISERAKSGEMPKAVQRASPLALAFPFATFRIYSGVCLSGGAKRRHLSMPSTRHGANFDSK